MYRTQKISNWSPTADLLESVTIIPAWYTCPHVNWPHQSHFFVPSSQHTSVPTLQTTVQSHKTDHHMTLHYTMQVNMCIVISDKIIQNRNETKPFYAIFVTAD